MVRSVSAWFENKVRMSVIGLSQLACICRPSPTVLNFFKPISTNSTKQPAGPKRQVCQATPKVLKKHRVSSQTSMGGRKQSPSIPVDSVNLEDDDGPTTVAEKKAVPQPPADLQQSLAVDSSGGS